MLSIRVVLARLYFLILLEEYFSANGVEWTLHYSLFVKSLYSPAVPIAAVQSDPRVVGPDSRRARPQSLRCVKGGQGACRRGSVCVHFYMWAAKVGLVKNAPTLMCLILCSLRLRCAQLKAF